MKKMVLVFVVLVLVWNVGAVSSDLRESYQPKETLIGEFSSDILSMSRDNVNLVRDGHIDVAFEYDLKKLGSKYYVWVIAPQGAGNYTLEIVDVVASVNGIPDVVNYEWNFIVEGESVSYSVNPGFVLATGNFKISATNYGENDETISVSFPSGRDVTLNPGVNEVDFSISDVIGVQLIDISFGIYDIPAHIIGSEYFCGDGEIDGSEVCDGSNLGDEMCATIPGGYSGGDLFCASDCLTLDVSGCELDVEEPVCGLGNLDLCLLEVDCTSFGGFWYDDTCNEYEIGAVCDSAHVGLCLSAGTCLDAVGYWYDDFCNVDPEPAELVCGDDEINVTDDGVEVCDGDNLGEWSCASIPGNYVGGELGCLGSCLEFNVSECVLEVSEIIFPPVFAFEPGLIRSTVLISEENLDYTFTITNNGEGPIEGMLLDYDRDRFDISPDEDISIEVNETVQFSLTVKDERRDSIRGVVVGYAGNVYEYMILMLDFTEDEQNVVTTYSGGSSGSNSGYQCSELLGVFCSSGEVCSTAVVETLDGSDCCSGVCRSTSSGSSAWIGYLIAGVVILVLLIIYVKYRKTKPAGKKNPLGTRVAGIEKKMP